jgi:hypothetical protein
LQVLAPPHHVVNELGSVQEARLSKHRIALPTHPTVPDLISAQCCKTDARRISSKVLFPFAAQLAVFQTPNHVGGSLAKIDDVAHNRLFAQPALPVKLAAHQRSRHLFDRGNNPTNIQIQLVALNTL